ncbi:MAG: ADP-ribosylglycohydrolase family protein [Gaiellaceae bacterium]
MGELADLRSRRALTKNQTTTSFTSDGVSYSCGSGCRRGRDGRDFAEGVVLAVNHGGDSNSTGAMTGNILGTATGVDAIPERWLAELELRDEIDQLAHDLHAIADGDDLALDTARYPTY